MKKRLAVGIVASMAPRVLEQTIAHWPEALCNVYVHVDLKFEPRDFVFDAMPPGLRFLSERIDVRWGGFSLVEAEIALMKAALADGFDHFLLISDDTVPLLSADEIVRRLETPESWHPVGITDLPHIRSRYDQFYCADLSVSNPKKQVLEYQPSDAELLLELHMAIKAGKVALPGLFWSSNWKALPYEDVVFVVEACADKGRLHQSFKFSFIPDEHYIPTILGRRPQQAFRVDKLIWADFSKEPKPYVLDQISDFDDPIREDYWLVRKVRDPAIARAIMARHTADAPPEPPGPIGEPEQLWKPVHPPMAPTGGGA